MSLKNDTRFQELTLQEAMYYYMQGFPLMLEDVYLNCNKQGEVPTEDWTEDYEYSTVCYNVPVGHSPADKNLFPFIVPEQEGVTFEDDSMVSIYSKSVYYLKLDYVLEH